MAEIGVELARSEMQHRTVCGSVIGWMNMYIKKAITALHSVCAACRDRGMRQGLLELKGKLWHRSRSVLYVKQVGAEVLLPDGIRIVTVTTSERQRVMPDIIAAGAGSDIRFFDSGAICYLAYKDNHSVGLGWLFRDSYLLRKVLSRTHEKATALYPNNQSPITNNRPPGAAYLAGFHVLDSARGQGLYPLLLNTMCRDAAASGRTSYVDVSPDNRASIRGLEKAGFRRVGELRTLTIAGIIIQCHLQRD